MNKDEIKKALECCSNPSISYCKGCPYANYGEFDCCNGVMCKAALNLINEQETEIEQLKAEKKQAQIDVLNKLKDSYGPYYLSAFGVKERMLADILNPMIEELKK